MRQKDVLIVLFLTACIVGSFYAGWTVSVMPKAAANIIIVLSGLILVVFLRIRLEEIGNMIPACAKCGTKISKGKQYCGKCGIENEAQMQRRYGQVESVNQVIETRETLENVEENVTKAVVVTEEEIVEEEIVEEEIVEEETVEEETVEEETVEEEPVEEEPVEEEPVEEETVEEETVEEETVEEETVEEETVEEETVEEETVEEETVEHDKCTECGYVNVENTEFCYKCGGRLEKIIFQELSDEEEESAYNKLMESSDLERYMKLGAADRLFRGKNDKTVEAMHEIANEADRLGYRDKAYEIRQKAVQVGNWDGLWTVAYVIGAFVVLFIFMSK